MSNMNRIARSVLRRLGQDQSLDNERQERLEREIDEKSQSQASDAKNAGDEGLSTIPESMLTESEKRHEHYRRRQAMAGKFPPAAERLPIMTSEEAAERDKKRPKPQASEFEAPLEKLIEKYKNLDEVQRRLTLGQAMKYEFTADGKILDQEGNLIYDGEKLVDNSWTTLNLPDTSLAH